MSDPKVGTGKKPPMSARRLYTDENPKDTIPIKFSNISDVKKTIRSLERLFKSGDRPHIRISQVAQVLEQRLRFMKDKKEEHKLAKRYTEFLKERTKLKTKGDRQKLKFKL
tara:strand:- start:244 stop:576 length:333 start_codon:yes stop_codon:yes gene_type:complete